jgi:hypothetical protein
MSASKKSLSISFNMKALRKSEQLGRPSGGFQQQLTSIAKMDIQQMFKVNDF